MEIFTEYPYRNLTDLNLDYILNNITKLQEIIKNFINVNTIKYADPIQWDITKQYEANTVVVDPMSNIAYISTKAVPTGISITNTDYWTPIFNLTSFIENISEAITSNDEGSHTAASRDYNMGEWLWINKRLYIASADITEGNLFVLNTNIRPITVEDMATMTYYPNDKKLTIRANISDYSEIVTSGDYHVYNPNTRAIEIKKVE